MSLCCGINIVTDPLEAKFSFPEVKERCFSISELQEKGCKSSAYEKRLTLVGEGRHERVYYKEWVMVPNFHKLRNEAFYSE